MEDDPVIEGAHEAGFGWLFLNRQVNILYAAIAAGAMVSGSYIAAEVGAITLAAMVVNLLHRILYKQNVESAYVSQQFRIIEDSLSDRIDIIGRQVERIEKELSWHDEDSALGRISKELEWHNDDSAVGRVLQEISALRDQLSGRQ